MSATVVNTTKGIFHWLTVGAAALGLTLAFFLILPLMQTIAHGPSGDMIVRTVDVANLPPPPPPPPEQKKEEEKHEDEKPPELSEDVPPLDLSQLELALNPGYGGDALGGDFAVKIGAAVAKSEDVDALFNPADLDQPPQLISPHQPKTTPQMRRRAPATVYIIFIVNQRGRVENPIVQSSTDPIFENAALAAVKQWKFNPGTRNGQPVRFRMRVPVTFPKEQ